MKTCPKCGYDKLADTARFCHKCGCDCAAVQVERTSAAEEPEAAPLVGDKNLINESTIIGKQEKYEASNITIHNNITEDHSHTTIVCAVSGKRIYLDHSVVCPKCGKQVALEYYVEASKRCENCEQQAREEYRAFVVRTTGAGPLDAACKQQLDAEAQRLQIDAATQASILRARQQKPAGKSAELTSVQRAELEAAVSRLITATEPEPAQKSLEALTVLHENSSNYEADYWYFLARAVVCPEESVKAYEEELTDDYWQRYWGFLGYCNTGSPKGGAAVDRLRSVFGQREDDIRDLLPCPGIRCVRDLDAGTCRRACLVGAAGVPFQAVGARLRYLAAACPRKYPAGGEIHPDGDFCLRGCFPCREVYRIPLCRAGAQGAGSP